MNTTEPVAPKTKEELEAERLNALQTLRTSYAMYESTKQETLEKRKKDKDKYSDASTQKTISLIEQMQADVYEKYIELGGNPDELLKKADVKKIGRKEIQNALKLAQERDAMKEYITKMNNERNNSLKNEENTPNKAQKEEYFEKITQNTAKSKEKKPISPDIEQVTEKETPNIEQRETISPTNDVPKRDGRNIPYDTIKLPSKGECYKEKFKELEVAYLTAYDENLILSPNLYKNGTFLDHILKNKILSNVNPDDLIQGDRDAIIIWLRASGYGNEYPIVVSDSDTGEDFETVVDLSQINYKKFTLKGDENGYFDFKLPNSGDIVKFKFLTNADTKQILELRNQEDKGIRLAELKECARKIRGFVEDDSLYSVLDAEKINEALNTLESKLAEGLEGQPENEYTHDITNRLILSTVSINGNSDRKYIVDYIMNMNIKDSIAYRNYIIENEPGIDYNIRVKKPDSLGGGYINTFLQLDQFIFID